MISILMEVWNNSTLNYSFLDRRVTSRDRIEGNYGGIAILQVKAVVRSLLALVVFVKGRVDSSGNHAHVDIYSITAATLGYNCFVI